MVQDGTNIIITACLEGQAEQFQLLPQAFPRGE